MAKLKTVQRKRLPASSFGLPTERKYPIIIPGNKASTKSHAINAKARATQMVDKKKLTVAEKKKIDAKANRVLRSLNGTKATASSSRSTSPARRSSNGVKRMMRQALKRR